MKVVAIAKVRDEIEDDNIVTSPAPAGISANEDEEDPEDLEEYETEDDGDTSLERLLGRAMEDMDDDDQE